MVSARLDFQVFVVFAAHTLLYMLLQDAKAANYSDKIDISRQSATAQFEESIGEVSSSSHATSPALDRLQDLFTDRLIVWVELLWEGFELVFRLRGARPLLGLFV